MVRGHRKTIEDRVKLKSRDDIKRIREAGIELASVFYELESFNLEDQSTYDIDHFIEGRLAARGCRGSFKTVPGYSYASCISVNDQVVHGIPNKKKIIQKGDIVKIDIGAVKNGFFADACRTYTVGIIEEEAQKLIRVAKRSLEIGISYAVNGYRLGDLGAAIQEYAESHHFSVVREYCGHGVGYAVHEAPTVLHYGDKGKGLLMREGLVIAIEPIINIGSYEVRLLSDGWTAVTQDGTLSAQFEETVAITEHGPEILTALA